MDESSKIDIIRYTLDYKINIDTRTIISNTCDITHKTVDHIFTSLDALEYHNSDSIKIMMNNPGGDYYHGMAIYDRIKNSPCHITILVYGHAMSMGSIILQAADLRLMSQHATFMIHAGSAGEFEGTPSELESFAENSKKIEEATIAIYNKRCNLSKKDLREMYKTSKYFTAKETVEYGFADKIYKCRKKKSNSN